MREMASIEIIEALCASRAGQRVAIIVEYAEGIAVLKRQRPHILERSLSRNSERLVLLGRGDPLQTPWRGGGFGMLRLLRNIHLRSIHANTVAFGGKQARTGFI
jgi:hypothetical protein